MNTSIVCSLNEMFFYLLYINVGGIKTKLKSLDFEQHIEQFDFVLVKQN